MNVSVATPCEPLAIVTAADCEPAGMVTAPITETTLGSLLLTVTGVSTLTLLVTSRTPTDDCAPNPAYTRPMSAEAARMTTTAIGFEVTSGSSSGGGVPTTTESCRMSDPAWNVSVAMPCAPVWMLTLTDCEPAGTAIGPATVATAGLLLVTVTGVDAPAAFDSSGSANACWPSVAA